MDQNTQYTQTINSDDFMLEDIFKDFYAVPNFQREFVWEEEQVEQYIEDIYNEYSDDASSSEYFIGSIVICPGANGVLDLIDGQQRMTTSYLFLCAVRDHIKEKNGKEIETLKGQIAATNIDELGNDVFRYRVELQYEDSYNVLQKIVKGSNDLSKISLNTRSVTNIINAYYLIRNFINREFENDLAGLRHFYAYFMQHVKLVRIKTESVAHALKVFETINDRGVGLDAMDLLKNLMFMNTNREDFDKLKDKWKALVDILFEKEKPLRFLRYFIFANYKVDRLKEDQIYSWFTNNESICGYADEPIEFIENLQKAAHAYTNFIAGKNIDATPNRYLVNIRYLSGAARQHLILLLAGMHLPIDLFKELSRQLENLFFAYIITREPTREFERNFAKWAPEVKLISNREGLDEFVRKNIIPAKKELGARFELALQGLRADAIQKYRMRYILGKITQYVNEMAYGDTEIDLTKFLNKRDLEHILPETPTSTIIADFDKPEEIYEFIQLFGNLTLLEDSINRSIRNKTYSEKCEYFEKSQYLITRSLAQIIHSGGNSRIDRAVKDLITFDKWTSESIELRQIMLTSLAKSVWNMPEIDQYGV